MPWTKISAEEYWKLYQKERHRLSVFSSGTCLAGGYIGERYFPEDYIATTWGLSSPDQDLPYIRSLKEHGEWHYWKWEPALAPHTPTPWHYGNLMVFAQIGSGMEIVNVRIADCLQDKSVPKDEQTANAAFIVRAVNAHEGLVKTLDRIINELPAKRDWLAPDLEAQARDILKAAKGEQPCP